MTKGYIHSTESFGTVDGPGIRFVIFTQGCPMRCMYCHNPDTWDIKKGTLLSSDELISQYNKNRVFYKDGGITVTGGEPLLQTDFLIELFKKAKDEGIHTCIDTSGITYNENDKEYIKKLELLMDYTDLVMLDIKHIDPDKHKLLTGHSNKAVLLFAKFLEKKNVPLWIRHIVVEGITDNHEDLIRLGEFIGELTNLKALDVLPYHTMGVHKYKELGIEYPLEGLAPLPVQKAVDAKALILEGVKNIRQKKQQP